ncbi:MAG: hypothetical protein RBT73_00765 [Spirochaetia bacterium]|jgi:hypothetical protein|nr:hypothetical protein [Spirochaetia bacterium]
MNIEFHYYALYYLCRSAGFPEEDSSRIAISSQMVDENLAPWEIVGGDKTGLSIVTQNYQFWDEATARSIYRPFHFIPGDRNKADSYRRDGRAGKHPVSADSPLARELLIAALRSGNLYRIGIALHAYADTWAHQNFSADLEPQNALDPRSPLPPVGHLQALRSPDNPRLNWKDPRLRDEYAAVRNSERFTQAAAMIYRFLNTSRKKGFEDEVFVIGRLKELWEEGSAGKGGISREDSLARASDYIIEFDIPPYEPETWPLRLGVQSRGILGIDSTGRSLGYDRLSWIRNAATKASSALGSIRGSISKSMYEKSDFAAWNQAAKTHLEYCNQVFKQRGIA